MLVEASYVEVNVRSSLGVIIPPRLVSHPSSEEAESRGGPGVLMEGRRRGMVISKVWGRVRLWQVTFLWFILLFGAFQPV